jgi:hypothetical protein
MANEALPDQAEGVARLSNVAPGLSKMDYQAILHISTSFEEAVDLARLKLLTVI